MCICRNSDASWLHLLRLTQLTSLRVAFLGGFRSLAEYKAASLGHETLSVAPLTRLVRLALPGVPVVALALSVGALGARLRELDLSHAGHLITPQLIIQVSEWNVSFPESRSMASHLCFPFPVMCMCCLCRPLM